MDPIDERELKVKVGDATMNKEIKRLRAGSIGVFAVAFMALATAAPITAMTGNVPIAVGFGNGMYAPGGYIFAGIILTIFTVGYAAMSRHITNTGSFYGFISHGLGPAVGFISGVLSAFAYIVFEASIIGIFASFTRTTIIAFHGPTISWVPIALVGIVLIALLGYFDISISGVILGVFLVTEVAILLLMSFSVLFHGGGPDGLIPQALSPIKAFSAVAADPKAGIVGSAAIGLFFAFWSWVGYETTAVYGEESKNPKKVIPKALIIVVIAIMVLYAFVSWMTIAGDGTHQAIAYSRSSNPFAMFYNVADIFVGGWAKNIYQVLIITGSFACALAFHNAASRYIYSIGRELPSKSIARALGKTHDKHKSPHVASITQTIITLAFVLGFWIFPKPTATVPDVAYSDIYGLLAILGTMIVLIVQSLCSISVISYFHVKKQHPETANVFRTIIAPIIGAAGMIYVIYLLFNNLSFAAGAAASSPFFHAIPWIVVAVAVLAGGYVLFLRQRHPDEYSQLGKTILEETQERD